MAFAPGDWSDWGIDDTNGGWHQPAQPGAEHDGCFAGMYKAGQCDDLQWILINVGHGKNACGLCFVGLCMTKEIAWEALPRANVNPALFGMLKEVDTDWTFAYYISEYSVLRLIYPTHRDAVSRTAPSSDAAQPKWTRSRRFYAKKSDLDPVHPPTDVRELLPESNMAGHIMHAECFDLLEGYWHAKGLALHNPNVNLIDLIGNYLDKEPCADGIMPFGSWGCGLNSGILLYNSAWRGSLDLTALAVDNAVIDRVNTQVEFFLQSPSSNERISDVVALAKRICCWPEKTLETNPGYVKIGKLVRDSLNMSEDMEKVARNWNHDAWSELVEWLPLDILPFAAPLKPDLSRLRGGWNYDPIVGSAIDWMSDEPAFQYYAEDEDLNEEPDSFDNILVPTNEHLASFFRSRFRVEFELSYISQSLQDELTTDTSIVKYAPFVWRLLGKANLKRMLLLNSFKGLLSLSLKFNDHCMKCNGSGDLHDTLEQGSPPQVASVMDLRLQATSLEDATPSYQDPRLSYPKRTAFCNSSDDLLDNFFQFYSKLTPEFDLSLKLTTVYAIVDCASLKKIDLTFGIRAGHDSQPSTNHYQALRGIAFETTGPSSRDVNRIELGECGKDDKVTAFEGNVKEHGDLSLDLEISQYFAGFTKTERYGPPSDEELLKVELKSANREMVALQALFSNVSHLASLIFQSLTARL